MKNLANIRCKLRRQLNKRTRNYDMRKLATIRKIDAVRPIPDADAIECAVIGGKVLMVTQANKQIAYVDLDAVVYVTIG